MKHKAVIIYFLFGFVLQSCSSHFAPVVVQEYLGDYELICSTASEQSVVRIAGDEEPGERLFLVGQVVDQETKEPISGAKIFFYQADHEGHYDSRFIGMPSLARISGSVKTDVNGCFILQTIIPGNYPDQIDGKHIHAKMKAPGYPTWNMEFLFEGYFDGDLRQEYEDRGDGIILNPVETLLPGIFIAECELEMGN